MQTPLVSIYRRDDEAFYVALYLPLFLLSPHFYDRPSPEFNFETRTLVATGPVCSLPFLPFPQPPSSRPCFCKILVQLVKRQREPGKHERIAKKSKQEGSTAIRGKGKGMRTRTKLYMPMRGSKDNAFSHDSIPARLLRTLPMLQSAELLLFTPEAPISNHSLRIALLCLPIVAPRVVPHANALSGASDIIVIAASPGPHYRS